jgi:hypothetical protein
MNREEFVKWVDDVSEFKMDYSNDKDWSYESDYA